MNKVVIILVLAIVKIVINGEFSVLQCKGTHYECFFKAGQNFQKQIKTVFTSYPSFPTLLNWRKNNKLLFQNYVDLVSSLGNGYILQEIKGLADGVGVDWEWLFVLNLENEISGWLGGKVAGEDCTDNFEGDSFSGIGHNEDGYPGFKNLTYILDFQLTNGKGLKDDRFVGFCYPGIIPGLAFNWNGNGFTLSMNAVTPSYIQMGLPKFAVNRHALNMESFEDLVMRTVMVKRSYGHSINIGSINDLNRQMLIELAPTESSVNEIIGNYSHMNN